MPLIAVTRLRLRSMRFLPQFAWFAFFSNTQVRRAPGHLRSQVLNGARHTFWTMSAWENEDAMRAFMTAGTHRRAMPKLREMCDEASVVHWLQDTAELPDWPEAHRRMVAEGRPSKVNHASPAHIAGEIAKPAL